MSALTGRHAPLTTHTMRTRFRTRTGRPPGRVAQMVNDRIDPAKFWDEISRIFDWKDTALVTEE